MRTHNPMRNANGNVLSSNGPTNNQLIMQQQQQQQQSNNQILRPRSAKWHLLSDSAFDDISGSDRRFTRLANVDNSIPNSATYRSVFVGNNVHNPHVSLVQCNRCSKSVTKAAFPAHYERCIQFDVTASGNQARLNDTASPSAGVLTHRQSIDSPFQLSNIDTFVQHDPSESKKRKSPGDASAEPKEKKHKKQRKSSQSLNNVKFDPDIHCGVIDRGDVRCMEFIDCRTHTLSLKKQVPDRNFSVNTLISRRKKEQERSKKAGSSSFDSDDSSASSESDDSSDSDNVSSASGSSDSSSSSDSDSSSDSSDSSENEKLKHSKSKSKQSSSSISSKKTARDRDMLSAASSSNLFIPGPTTPDLSSTISPRDLNLKKIKANDELTISPSNNLPDFAAKVARSQADFSSNLSSPSLRSDPAKDAASKLKKPRSKRIRGPLMVLGLSSRSTLLSHAGISHQLALARSVRAVQSMLMGSRTVPVGANPTAPIYVELYNAAHLIEDKRPIVQAPNPAISSKMTPINTLNPSLSASSRLTSTNTVPPLNSRSPPLLPANATSSPLMTGLSGGGARTPSNKSSVKPSKDSSSSKKDKDSSKSSKDKDKSDASLSSKDKDKEKKKSKDKDRDRERERDGSKSSKDKYRDRESKDEGSKKGSKDKEKESKHSKHKDKSNKDRDREKSSKSSDRDGKDRDKEKEKSKKDKSSKDKSSKNKSTSSSSTPSHTPMPMPTVATPTPPPAQSQLYYPPSPSNHSVGSQQSQRYQPPNPAMSAIPPQYPRPPSSGSPYAVSNFALSRGSNLPANGPVSPHGTYNPHMSPQPNLSQLNPGISGPSQPPTGRSLNINQAPPHSPAGSQTRGSYRPNMQQQRPQYPPQQMNPAYTNQGYGIQSPVPPNSSLVQQMSTPPFNQRVFPSNYNRGMPPTGVNGRPQYDEYDPSVTPYPHQ